ncbi:hypothetical protein DBV15_07260 [Temnothorax longispinosus]|uniref:Uncharacterized protein n=1 Tax=Temnothorax longispinosus TaxID=300112 RepID=A0A4S2JJB9_9HYME|nr:hypothetical protein DBV15_07260 [Temnothorax longispinosus]
MRTEVKTKRDATGARSPKSTKRHGVARELSEYNKLIEGSVPRYAGNTLALLARRCMAPSSSKGRHTPFQRTFLYLYIDPLTRIRGSFKDMAMGACWRGETRIFVLFSLLRADFRPRKARIKKVSPRKESEREPNDLVELKENGSRRLPQRRKSGKRLNNDFNGAAVLPPLFGHPSALSLALPDLILSSCLAVFPRSRNLVGSGRRQMSAVPFPESSEIFHRLGPPSPPFSSSTAKVQFIFGAECTVNAIVKR